MYEFTARGLSVGYDGQALIRDIDVELGRGEILTLIGPNGSGKSTILKTITRQLASISGAVYIGRDNLGRMSYRDVSRRMSVMLTERIAPELMTCFDVVASGRYPYTNRFGQLTPHDREVDAGEPGAGAGAGSQGPRLQPAQRWPTSARAAGARDLPTAAHNGAG